nr:hypothetical protein [Tanacetum cinerariifolium]
MTSFDYRLNPLYPIKECSSCGALYTTDYCCSVGILEDKIICDLDKTPDLSQRSPQNCPKYGHPVDGHYCQGCALLRKKFKEDLFTSSIENGILQDSSEPSNDNTNVVNAPREPFVVNQNLGKNSSQSPPQINHHCCYDCGDPLEGIFCHHCTCKLCGNGAHYGYNCSPKVPIIHDLESFNNQTIKELPPTVQSFDPKSDLVHDSPNIFDHPSQLPFIPCEFCGNDACYGHYCTPQVAFVYPEPCHNQEFNFSQESQNFQQQYLCCENYSVTHEAYQCQPRNEDYYHEQNSCYDHNSFGFDQFQPQQYTVNHPIFNVQNELFDSQTKLMEEMTSMCDMKITACYDDDDDDNAFTITPNEPDNSVSMGDEHLDTILTTKSDKFIKFSVENLVPIPSESEGENECDVPAYEEFTTFSNILFDSDYDFYSSDDQSFSDEDFPKEIYSNPLFDEEFIPMKIDPHPFNVESDLIESLLNHDSSIISSSKIDSLFDEFTGELTLLKSVSPRIDETDYDPEEETHFIKRLLYDNSSPHPSEEFVFENSDVEIESFSPIHIPVRDSDSLMEEIDLSFTPDYPMPPGIEDDDYDSERDVLILDELLSNNSLSLPENESFYFDIPSFSRPPVKPSDGNIGILNEEEKQIEEDQADNAQYWKILACYDDDDDYTFAITPNKPDNSLKSMLNHDSSIISSSSKIDSLFDEFAGELTLLKSIPLGISETDWNPENEIHLTKRLLHDNSSPCPSKEFISKNSDAAMESFSPSPIPVEDSDSLMEEIDLSSTPDDPMPPGIEEDDYDSKKEILNSEREILILEEFLDNYSLSLPENESFHFDIPLSSRPFVKPPHGNTGILNIKTMGDISEQKVPIPRLMITRVSNQEKSPDLLSYQGLEIF